MTTLGTVSLSQGKILSFWFDVNIFEELTEISPDSSESIIEDDKLITRFTTSKSGQQVTLTPITNYALNNEAVRYIFESDNPTQINVNVDGVVVYQVPPEQSASAVITIKGFNGPASIERTVLVYLDV